MKVYVDELPKDCIDCEFGYFYDCQYCTLRPDLMRKDEWCEKEKDCPLQSLADYTKQVRKEVCEKIKKQIFNHFNVKNMEEYENLSLIDSLFTADAVIEMLDTILKEYQK